MNDVLPLPADFRFASPLWLWALVLLPVWMMLRGRVAPVAAVCFSSTAMLAVARRHSRARFGWLLPALRYLALALLILALARPQRDVGFLEHEAEGVNIMFSLDFSGSMRATDFTLEGQPASRLEVMKHVVAEFIRNRPHDRIGAVFFDRGAHLLSPLTLDHDWLIQHIMDAESSMGTAPGSGMLVAAEALLPAEGQSRVIVTVTDADQINQGAAPLEVAGALQPMGIKHHVIQIVPPHQRGFFSHSIRLLSEAARLNDGQFFQVSDTQELRRIYTLIDSLEKSAFSEKRQEAWEELMSWFAGPALGLLALSFIGQRTWGRSLP